MTLDLDHELKQLGASWLAEVEPFTTEVVLERTGIAITRGGAATALTGSPARPRGRRTMTTVAKVAACVITLAIVGVTLNEIQDDGPVGQESIPSSPPSDLTTAATDGASIGPAEVSWPPRLIIEGYWIDSINEVAHVGIEFGEVSYRSNGGSVWMAYLADSSVALLPGSPEVARLDVLGVPAVMYGDSATTGPVGTDTPLGELDGFSVDVDINDVGLRFSSNALTAEEFGEALSSIHPVDDAAFLAALPVGAVTGGERERWLDAILFDTPLPESFDRGALGNRDAIMMVNGFRGLGGRAAIEVACAWTDQWFDAESSGDSSASAEAAVALGSIRTWAVFGSIDAYVVNDFARVTDALIAGEPYVDLPLDRERVDEMLSCAAGQLPWG